MNSLLELSYEGGKLVVFRRGLHHVVAQTDFGVSIEFDGSSVGWVKIPMSLMNMTEGLCGNHNNDVIDDLTGSSGELMPTDSEGISAFGNSWQVEDPESPQWAQSVHSISNYEYCVSYFRCKGASASSLPECEDSKMEQLKAKDLCGVVLEYANGPFEECFDVDDFPVEKYTQNCIHDVCPHLDDSDIALEIACASLAVLAAECELHGVTVDWRGETGCCKSEAFIERESCAHLI